MQELARLIDLYWKSKKEGLIITEYHEAVEILQHIIEKLTDCKKCNDIEVCDNNYLRCPKIKKVIIKTMEEWMQHAGFTHC